MIGCKVEYCKTSSQADSCSICKDNYFLKTIGSTYQCIADCGDGYYKGSLGGVDTCIGNYK